MTDKNFFNYANAIQNKTKIEWDEKACNNYMLLLHLSHCNEYLPIINPINERIFDYIIPNECIFKYYMDKIPRGRKGIRWVKKNKIKEAKVEKLMEKYGISKREALLCLS